MGQLGVGVMINMLSGNSETVAALIASVNQKITKAKFDQENNQLRLSFENGTTLVLWDDGQSCCESRYMRTDDDLSEYAGATLLDFELKAAPEITDEYGEHEVQFLDIKTDKGIFQMANHNEHNGYYGGFSIAARLFTEA